MTYKEFDGLDNSSKLRIFNKYLEDDEYGAMVSVNRRGFPGYVGLISDPPADVADAYDITPFSVPHYDKNDKYVFIGCNEFGQIDSFNDFRQIDALREGGRFGSFLRKVRR